MCGLRSSLEGRRGGGYNRAAGADVNTPGVRGRVQWQQCGCTSGEWGPDKQRGGVGQRGHRCGAQGNVKEWRRCRAERSRVSETAACWHGNEARVGNKMAAGAVRTNGRQQGTAKGRPRGGKWANNGGGGSGNGGQVGPPQVKPWVGDVRGRAARWYRVGCCATYRCDGGGGA